MISQYKYSNTLFKHLNGNVTMQDVMNISSFTESPLS